MFDWFLKSIQRQGIFARITVRARKVMSLAKIESRLSNRNYIDTEDILRGILKEGNGVGFHALVNMNVNIAELESQIKKLTKTDKTGAIKKESFQTLPAQEVIMKAMEEAKYLCHNYMGTEHLLLGLLRVDQGVAAQSLSNVGVSIEKAREGVGKTLVVAAKNSKSQRPWWKFW